jgi:hypothetical protein
MPLGIEISTFTLSLSPPPANSTSSVHTALCILLCSPEFYHQLWLSVACLFAAASAFSAAHFEITAYMRGLRLLPACAMALLRLPIGLHAIWLFVAVLLTLNSWLAVSQARKVLQILAAFCSAFLGALLGLSHMYYTADATFGITMAFTLDALACRALENSYAPQVRLLCG